MTTRFSTWTMWILLLVLSGCGGGGGDNGDGDDGSGGNGGSGSQNFEVSGTLSGLSSGTVEIRNRNEAPIVVSPGGFSFVVQGDTGYSISILRNAVEHFCRLVNGSASSISGNVSNVEIICESAGAPGVAAACTGATDSDEDSLTDCDEFNVHRTNPWLSDSDGDGVADDEELSLFNAATNVFLNNPRVADFPSLSVDLLTLPEIKLDFTTGTTTGQTLDTTYSDTSSTGISRDRGGSTSNLLEASHTTSTSATVTVGTEIEASPTDLGVKLSVESSLTEGFERSRAESWGSSVTWNESQRSDNSSTYSTAVSQQFTSTNTVTGGTLSVGVSVRNRGNISYRLDNLTLSAFAVDRRQPFDVSLIGALTFGGGAPDSFPDTPVLSGGSSQLSFQSNTPINVATAMALLRDSPDILIQPSTFLLLDATGQTELQLQSDTIRARTATVILDRGTAATNGEQKYQVAVDRGDGSKSLSVLEVLQDALQLQVTQGADQWLYPGEVNPRATQSGLLQIDSLAHGDTQNRYWLLAHNLSNASGARTTTIYNLLQAGYDLSQIALRAGDVITVSYIGDQDRDGIPDRTEATLGTDPGLADTDADGLFDAVEVYGWLTDLDGPDCLDGTTVRIYSNPLRADSDNDGIEDGDEKIACSNPGASFSAVAGDDLVVQRGASVTLGASLLGGTPVQTPSYTWNLVSGQSGANFTGIAQLSDATPTFSAPDEVTTLVYELEITADGETAVDRVSVQVLHELTGSCDFDTRCPGAHFVGGAGPGTPDGSMANPWPSIATAFSNLGAGDDVYVMAASPIALVDTLDVPDGTSMFGGYDANWQRLPLHDRTNEEFGFLGFGRTQLFGTRAPLVRIAAASSEMRFSGFAVLAQASSLAASIVALQVGPSGPGAGEQPGKVFITDNFIASFGHFGDSPTPGSSHAVIASNLADLEVNENLLFAERAAHGADGARGSDGIGAQNPHPGCCSGSAGAIGAGGVSAGGNGGGGGANGTAGFVDGGRGSNGLPGGGGAAGGPGGAGGTNGAGGRGSDGTPGANGAFGAGGVFVPRTASGGYTPANGQDGADGQGGGGGGGGGGGEGFATSTGGTGGGGGGGGSGGTGGAGGAGGGAAIALWLENVTIAQISANLITARDGGNGASGGGIDDGINPRGSTGGRGGPGSSGNIRGGTGGTGGAGGNGGFGGSGAGGPSFGIFVGVGLDPVLTDNTIASGNGGRAGVFGNNGRGGDSYAVFDADPGDGATPSLTGSTNSLSFGAGGSSFGTPGNAGQRNF